MGIPETRRCLNCGVDIGPARRANASPFCSGRCRSANFRATHPEYVERNNARSAESYRANYAPPRHERVCVECGESFVARHGRRKVCSDVCRYRMNYRARRARRARAQREVYTFVEIATRDGWQCGICGGEVESSRIYPDPLAGSLDHVVPLARGGDDIASNVQLAHLSCNWAKGARAAA